MITDKGGYGTRRAEGGAENRPRTSVPEGSCSSEKQTLWIVDKLRGPSLSSMKKRPVAPVPMTPEDDHMRLEQHF